MPGLGEAGHDRLPTRSERGEICGSVGPPDGMIRFRTRLPALLSVWAVATGAEAILYFFFLSRPYFRAVALPFALGVLAAALLATWRLLRGRWRRDRRTRERRAARRRGEEQR